MKNIFFISLILSSLIIFGTSCKEQTANAARAENQSKSRSQVVPPSNKVQVPKEKKKYSPESITDSRDGEVYQTLIIGSQTWMIENLRYKVKGAWLNPSNPSSTYGRLYDWATIMNGSETSSTNPSQVQGLCPDGWHLPSDSEWSTLEISLGMSSKDSASVGYYRGPHATSMKSTTGWSLDGNGTNVSQFDIFPAGSNVLGDFTPLGETAIFWSSTDTPYNGYAWGRCFFYPSQGVHRLDGNKKFGFSCRCVQD